MKKFAFQLYPLLIFVGAFALIRGEHAHAGQIRKLELNPDQPGVVHLAFGRTTAVSFSVRPEKVVPGSPQAIEVNFLGKDLTIRPLGPKPGNILIYTKNSRFVILLQIGSESHYDDVVKVAPIFGKTPIRLLDDSFRVVSLTIETRVKQGKPEIREVPVSLLSNERTIEGVELRDALGSFAHLSCSGCVLRRVDDLLRIVCTRTIHEIQCRSRDQALTLRRASP